MLEEEARGVLVLLAYIWAKVRCRKGWTVYTKTEFFLSICKDCYSNGKTGCFFSRSVTVMVKQVVSSQDSQWITVFKCDDGLVS